MDEDMRPIGDVLDGFTTQRLPQGIEPQAAYMFIKCIDSDGDERWFTPTGYGPSGGELNQMEILGMLSADKRWHLDDAAEHRTTLDVEEEHESGRDNG